MDELKRMLKIIHEENKTILGVLLSMDKDKGMTLEELLDGIDEMYDKGFYGE